MAYLKKKNFSKDRLEKQLYTKYNIKIKKKVLRMKKIYKKKIIHNAHYTFKK